MIDIFEITHLKKLPLLWDLNLLQNPIHDIPGCRLAIIFHVPCLIYLDHKKVEIVEKVSGDCIRFVLWRCVISVFYRNAVV